ncbi:MAG TPA: hypothetical protein VLL28_01280 [Hyphomicrobiaceae bacterium]|nr:hypothetical protein [Hyphomicrobiaceae bacterium]
MAAAAAGAPGSASLGERALQTARASARTGVPAIDIHAHYYP